jgi:endogenous inhibitor of DNA gyrase (YacG/DUF329 family)
MIDFGHWVDEDYAVPVSQPEVSEPFAEEEI